MDAKLNKVILIDTWLLTNKRTITYSAFGVLFVIRALSGYISATSPKDISRFLAFFFTASLISITLFVLANKDHLDIFNIDKYAVYTLVLSGVLLFLSFEFLLLEIVAITCALLVSRMLRSLKNESYKTASFLLIFPFTLLGIVPEVLFKLFLPSSLQYPDYYLNLSAGQIVVLVSLTLWYVMIEEMLFRSILWGILREWKLNNKRIIIAQAFLFWLVHLDGIITPSHAIPIFIFGIWSGFLVLRSKSLTPSITVHIIHNLTSRLIY